MEELKLFLQQHPHLQAFQNRLDREMDSVPDSERIFVILKYIQLNLEELDVELKLLRLMLSRA